jgi:hypothetical protein
MTSDNPALASLSDAELLSATREIVSRSHVLEADLLAHLGEIDERRLYLESRFPSMFAFCVEELGFSEDAAYNRITVARAGRRLPGILDELRTGRVHLAGLRLLAPHLTELNYEVVLPQAAHKSKRMIEELVARLAPSPPIRTGIRRVPECAVPSWSPIPSFPPPGTPMPPFTPETASFCFAAAVQAASSGAGPAAPACAAGPPLSGIEQAQSVAVPRAHSAPRSVMSPLSAETFAVQFTASRELRDKISEARALLCHSVPDGDLASIIEKGLDLLIEKVKKKRFGLGRKPRAPAGRSSENSESTLKEDAGAPSISPESVVNDEGCAGAVEADASEMLDEAPPSIPPPILDGPDSESLSRHIPDAVKRAVYERDGGRCTFVDDQRRRCTSARVQFDHRDGFARTHTHTVESIRLRCPAHNQHAANEMYGREFMDRARATTPRPPVDTDPATRPGTC